MRSSYTKTGAIRKVWRFVKVYGLLRTYYKVIGRSRSSWLPRTRRRRDSPICLIGCGQFGFATIGFYVANYAKLGFASCYDSNRENAKSFADFYRVGICAETADQAMREPRVNTVYIASNHASHTEYALKALELGKTVYVEKPVAVSYEQLASIRYHLEHSGGEIFAGYNRPFSKAIRDLEGMVREPHAPITLSCMISGHFLADDHWYRDPEEGTRICGNLGHWLDLLVHLLNWGDLPDQWRISLMWSDPDSRDDNVSVSMASERGDLANFVLTSRCEPFEGINENISINWGTCIAKIDDFRRMTVWDNETLKTKRYRPKDVGHQSAILQPWSDKQRDWGEVESSTRLMLKIAEMVKTGTSNSEFSFSNPAAQAEAQPK